jgi:hypothetical protein
MAWLYGYKLTFKRRDSGIKHTEPTLLLLFSILAMADGFELVVSDNLAKLSLNSEIADGASSSFGASAIDS